jgi:hypothetical protein
MPEVPQMSRVQYTRNGWVHFVMQCDDCGFESEPKKSMDALKLIDFRVAGWFIAQHYGDSCPDCKIKGKHLGRAPMPWSTMVFPLMEHQKGYKVEDEFVLTPRWT